jgi:8-oxo-dGTP diphosphatase
MKQFGEKVPGARYVERPAAHAVVFDRSGKVAAVGNRGKFYLPGGGLEAGESMMEALHREMAEETGWTIIASDPPVRASEYVFAQDEETYFQKIGHFFVAEVVGTNGEKSDADHSVHWLTPDEFKSGAAHESHVWAVAQAIEDFAKNHVA